MSNLRLRFAAAMGTAVSSLVIFILTMVSHDWIEVLSGADPDHGNGSAERLILGAFLAVSLIALTLASLEWRRMRAVAVGSR
jgi:hypothetical protein